MSCSQWTAIIAAILGLISFHFLYSDGWSFDGTWSKFKELRERIFPLKENRVPFWWRAPVGYFCALVSMTLWIISSCTSENSLKKVNTNAGNLSAVERAVEAAKIHAGDSVDIKIQKALTLINQNRYYYPKNGTPQKLDPRFDERYHLDSLRTPEDILIQKIGGYCGSAALVFSAILRQSGVPNDDLYIVAGVFSKDLELICPQKNKPRVEHPKTGASGHVFVAVHFTDRGWRLINTIDGSNYESVSWLSPEEVNAKMKLGPVPIPFDVYRRFPDKLRSLPMVVFQQWRSDLVPLHTFDQRLDLIASGKIAKSKDTSKFSEAKICRYDKSDLARVK